MARRRTGPLLFVPGRWQRAAFLTWLKRIHAWTGLWGALLFLLLGTSGVLLNHRTLLKIDTGAPREVSTVDVAVSGRRIGDAHALDAWTKATFGVSGMGRSPPPTAADAVKLLDRTIRPAPRLSRVFTLVDGQLTVSTVPGSSIVTVTRDRVGVLAILKNMHKGSGLGIAWILLIDTIAGALTAMSVTGVLLWSRLHGTRLAAAMIAGGSSAWALSALLPEMGLGGG